MQLIQDWKRKFPRLWSVRFALLASVLASFEVGITAYLTGHPPLLALFAAVASMAAAVSRVVAQPKLAHLP